MARPFRSSRRLWRKLSRGDQSFFFPKKVSEADFSSSPFSLRGKTLVPQNLAIASRGRFSAEHLKGSFGKGLSETDKPLEFSDKVSQIFEA